MEVAGKENLSFLYFPAIMNRYLKDFHLLRHMLSFAAAACRVPEENPTVFFSRNTVKGSY